MRMKVLLLAGVTVLVAVLAVAGFDVWQKSQILPPPAVEPAAKPTTFAVEQQGEILTISGAVVAKQDDGLIIDVSKSDLFKIALPVGEQIKRIFDGKEQFIIWDQVEAGDIVMITINKEERENGSKKVFALTSDKKEVKQATPAAE